MDGDAAVAAKTRQDKTKQEQKQSSILAVPCQRSYGMRVRVSSCTASSSISLSFSTVTASAGTEHSAPPDFQRAAGQVMNHSEAVQLALYQAHVVWYRPHWRAHACFGCLLFAHTAIAAVCIMQLKRC